MTIQMPRVLVVEDETMVSMVLVEDLSKLGYTICGPFDDVDAAAGAARTQSFDIALVDINLRDEMSFEVLDTLMAVRTPTAIMTAYDREGLPKRFAGLPLLAKPYSGLALVLAVEALSSQMPATAGEPNV